MVFYQGNGKITKAKAKVNTQQLGRGVCWWVNGQIALKIMWALIWCD